MYGLFICCSGVTTNGRCMFLPFLWFHAMVFGCIIPSASRFFSHAKEETGIGRHPHHAGVGHFKCKHLGLWTWNLPPCAFTSAPPLVVFSIWMPSFTWRDCSVPGLFTNCRRAVTNGGYASALLSWYSMAFVSPLAASLSPCFSSLLRWGAEFMAWDFACWIYFAIFAPMI